MNFTEDPAAFDADFTEQVTRRDGSAFLGHVEFFDEERFDITAARHTVEYWTAAAPGMEEGERLVVDAVVYEVAEPPRRLGDGARSILTLRAV